MKSTLDSIAFFKNIRPMLEEMTDEDAGALIKALFAHDDGEDVDLSGKSQIVRITFPLVAESTDRLTKKRMGKVRATANEPQTDLNDTANEPQTDREPSHHSHSQSQDQSHGHNHDDMPVQAGKAGPSVREVREYAEEEGLVIDAERFVAYYDARDWRTGTDPIKDWKKIARKWAVTERKEPAKPPDKPKKTGKYMAWLESQDYSSLVDGRRA